MNEIKPISFLSSVLLFLIPGFVFYAVIGYVVPFVSDITGMTNYLVWLFAGTLLLFGPLFFLTLLLLKKDGFELNLPTIRQRLLLKRISLKDILWVMAGMIICVLLSGILVAVWWRFSPSFDIHELKAMSPIEVNPLTGGERIALIFLPVFFFFNYFGEELLWRGYILPRQIAAIGQYSWVVNAILHGIFHMAFSFQMLFFFMPFLLFMPFIVYKRKNTSLAILVHFLVGAPTQLFVALGIIF